MENRSPKDRIGPECLADQEPDLFLLIAHLSHRRRPAPISPWVPAFAGKTRFRIGEDTVKATNQGYRPGLVNMAAGQISREIFVNEEIYQEEQERLFARVWLFVGHESQIPRPGDYVVSGMGEESVILCRDR